MTTIEIGRLLRSSTTGFIMGCRVSQLQEPAFGALVRAPISDDYQVFGLIYDIHIDDDGLVRQLVTAANPVAPEVIADNRVNRNVPVEISVLSVGYQQGQTIYHLLPPRPPLSLDMIYPCEDAELRAFTLVAYPPGFTSAGRFGYFRHILRAINLPVAELLAAHLQQAQPAHRAAGSRDWINQATQELIILLRDDYPTLMSVLGAIGELW
jgi:hypothetical protein